MSVPSESQTPDCQAKYDDYLSYISDIDVHSLHFIDESYVTKTSEKRKYGSSEVGKRAIEIQPYACLKCELYNQFITQYTWH